MVGVLRYPSRQKPCQSQQNKARATAVRPLLYRYFADFERFLPTGMVGECVQIGNGIK